MFGKFSFLINMLFFTLIPIGFIWFRNFNFLKTQVKTVGALVIIAVALQFISDPFAIYWKAWFFVSEKNLGITVINFPIEDLIFVVLIMTVVSSAVLVLLSPKGNEKTDEKIYKK